MFDRSSLRVMSLAGLIGSLTMPPLAHGLGFQDAGAFAAYQWDYRYVEITDHAGNYLGQYSNDTTLYPGGYDSYTSLEAESHDGHGITDSHFQEYNDWSTPFHVLASSGDPYPPYGIGQAAGDAMTNSLGAIAASVFPTEARAMAYTDTFDEAGYDQYFYFYIPFDLNVSVDVPIAANAFTYASVQLNSIIHTPDGEQYDYAMSWQYLITGNDTPGFFQYDGSFEANFPLYAGDILELALSAETYVGVYDPNNPTWDYPPAVIDAFEGDGHGGLTGDTDGTIRQIPEPTTSLTLMALGGLALLARRR